MCKRRTCAAEYPRAMFLFYSIISAPLAVLHARLFKERITRTQVQQGHVSCRSASWRLSARLEGRASRGSLRFLEQPLVSNMRMGVDPYFLKEYLMKCTRSPLMVYSSALPAISEATGDSMISGWALLIYSDNGKQYQMQRRVYASY